MKTPASTTVTKTNAPAFRLLFCLILFAILSQPAAIAQIPTNGLVFHWNMDETSGLVANDLSTNGNNGKLIGTNWPAGNAQWITDGQSGRALHMYPDTNGSSAVSGTRVEMTGITNAGVTNIWANTLTTNSRTWAIWVRVLTNSPFQNVIGEPTGAGAGNNLGFDTTGLIPRVLWNNGGTGSATIQSGAGAIATNVWTHLALTYDYQNKSNLTLYVNGSVQASASGATVRPFLRTFELGTRGNNSFAFPGDVDDVYYYNRVLSVSEVAALAGVPLGPPQITAPVKNTVVWQGDLATMSVGAGGVGTLSYQWYKNSVPLANATNSIFTNSMAAQPSDDGVYSVLITNLIGSVTSSASLFVRPTMVIPASTPSWIPTNGLVFYWNMDNTTSFEALDYSGNNHHGALVNFPFDGSQQVSGFIGNALHVQSINGSLPQVVVTNLPMITNLTWACWVKAKPSGNSCAMSSSFPGAAAGSTLGFGSGANDMHPRILWNNGVASTTLQGPEALDYNDWNQLGCTYDGASTTMTLYLNGKPSGVNNVCSSTPFNLIAVGIRLATQAFNMNGDIDEVLCYNRVLSPGEMVLLYTNAIANGQLPFRYVQVAISDIRVSTNYDAPYGLTNYFINVPTNGGFLEVDMRTLWTNGVPMLLGATNLANPTWQVVTGAQFAVNSVPQRIGSVLATNSIGNLTPPNLFIRGAVTPPAPLFYDNFESGAPGWTHGGAGDSWALGVPTNPDGPSGGSNGRTNVYGTGLSANYNGGEIAWLHSPPINLGGLQQATIVYWEWANIYPNTTFDYGQVNLVDADTLQTVATGLWQVSGTSTNYTSDGWVERMVDIPSPNTMTSTNVMIEFLMNTDPFNPTYPGWFIDDVEVLPYGNPK
jgi:hypothetical protein